MTEEHKDQCADKAEISYLLAVIDQMRAELRGATMAANDERVNLTMSLPEVIADMRAEIDRLPPLPNILGLTSTRIEQIMRTYATAAVLADREQRGEPVAWLNVERKAITQNGYEASCWRDQWPVVVPLYLHPQPVEQRKPLTQKQVWALPGMRGWMPHDHYRLERVVRAVEAAHGIKGAT